MSNCNNVIAPRSSTLASGAVPYVSPSNLPCSSIYVYVKSLHGAAPDYLVILRYGVSTSRAGARLRSEVKGDLKVRKSEMSCFGDRAFSVVGPRWWNNIPTSIRSASTLESFKSILKTHYFEKSYL